MDLIMTSPTCIYFDHINSITSSCPFPLQLNLFPASPSSTFMSVGRCDPMALVQVIVRSTGSTPVATSLKKISLPTLATISCLKTPRNSGSP